MRPVDVLRLDFNSQLILCEFADQLICAFLWVFLDPMDDQTVTPGVLLQFFNTSLSIAQLALKLLDFGVFFFLIPARSSHVALELAPVLGQGRGDFRQVVCP